MRIVFIGAGNVATHLATELHKYSFDIVEIYSRTIESAKILAKKVDAKAINNIASISTDADFYFFSLKDSVLEDIASQVLSNNGIWIHTAGSIPLNVFKEYTSRYGVLYPFQTFSKERNINWEKTPICIEANNEEAYERIMDIANILSSKVIELSSEQRKYIHLTGVFACNFTNYMYTLSAQILESLNLPFNFVLPLIEETCDKVHTLSPIDAQTGPAIRFDENVMNKQLELIEDKKVKEIYRLISEKIHETHKNK